MNITSNTFLDSSYNDPIKFCMYIPELAFSGSRVDKLTPYKYK